MAFASPIGSRTSGPSKAATVRRCFLSKESFTDEQINEAIAKETGAKLPHKALRLLMQRVAREEGIKAKNNGKLPKPTATKKPA